MGFQESFQVILKAINKKAKKMNLKDTIFILGAGASKPYGYPTAGELRKDIIENYKTVIQETLKEMHYGIEDINDELRKIKPIIESFDLSHTNSIDLFLTRNRESVNVTLGIQIIWLYIIWYEMRSKLSSQIEEHEEDWYYEFFNELTGDLTSKEDLLNLPEQKLTFITFNYDRSLENFLFLSFQNSFYLTVEETKNIIDKHFVFFHVYGKILNLEWESSNQAAPYKNKMSLFLLPEAPRLIKLIYDDRQITESVQKIIKENSIIIFLGFGFSKVNIDFLNLRELLTSQHRCIASGIGLYESRIRKIESFLQRGIVGIKAHNIQIEPKLNSLQILRKYIFLKKPPHPPKAR